MTSINHPTQVVLVTCAAHAEIMGREIEKEDIVTIAWHMQTSFDPLLYAISVAKTRFSCELIKKSRVFVVNFIPYKMKQQAIFCGTHTGRHMDKFKETGLTKEEAEKVECPRIKEALAYLECEVIDEIETGDHIVFVGKVVNSVFKNKGKRLLQKSHLDFTTTVD